MAATTIQTTANATYFTVDVDFLNFFGEKVIKSVDILKRDNATELVVLRFVRPVFVVDDSTVPSTITPDPDPNNTAFVLHGPTRESTHTSFTNLFAHAQITGSTAFEDALLGFICPYALAGIRCLVKNCCMAPKPQNVIASCTSSLTGRCHDTNCQLNHDTKRIYHFCSSAFHALRPAEWFLSPYFDTVLQERLRSANTSS